MKKSGKHIRLTAWLLMAALLFTALPVHVLAEGETPAASEMVAYVSKAVKAGAETYALSENVTIHTISSDWQDAATQWTWTTNANYVVNTDYRPLYTNCVGATITMDMGVPAAEGQYDVYYYTIQAANATSGAMTWTVHQGEAEAQTVTVPAKTALESGATTIAQWEKVGSVSLNATDKVTFTYTVPEQTGSTKPNARATAIKLVPATEAAEGDESATGGAEAVNTATAEGTGEEADVGREMIAYVSKNYTENGAYLLSDNVTVLIPIKTSVTDYTIPNYVYDSTNNTHNATNQWTWTTNENYVVDTSYRPLYTTYKGNSIEIDMGTPTAAGKYDVYYYTIEVAKQKNGAMTWNFSQDGSADQTVNIAEIDHSQDSNFETTRDWEKVGEVDLNATGKVIASYTHLSDTNSRVTAIKLAPHKDEEEGNGGEETPTTNDIVVWAGANGKKEQNSAFTGTPAVGGGWGSHEKQWVWSGGTQGGEQYPLYTYMEGATFTFDLGQPAAGIYEVAYFTINGGKTPEMKLSIKEGEEEKTTVNVPAYPKENTACWLTVGTVKLSGGKVTVHYTNPASTINARATGVKLTPIDNTIKTGDIVKSAMVEADHTKSTGDYAWSVSSGLKNYDNTNTLYTVKKGSTLSFNTTNLIAGNYKVYYWVTPHDSNMPSMPLTVKHNGQETEVMVPIDENAAGGWYYMGTFDFAAEGNETVDFVHPGGEKGSLQARGTAVKFTPTTHGVYVPENEAEDDTGNDTEDAIIDVDPYPGFSFVGGWKTSSALPGPMSKSAYSMWISKKIIDASQEPFNTPAENYCQYKPDITTTGGVKISAYLLYWNTNQTNKVKYEIHYNGNVETKEIDMTTLTKSGWHDLGTYDFSGPEETNFVRVVCTDADNYGEDTNFRASTVRFEVLNNAASGGIWQTVYVTPSQMGEVFKVAELNQFKDIAEDAAIKYDVEYMYNEGYVTGTSETVFSPDENITRSDFMSYLSKVLKLSDDSAYKALLKGVNEDELLTKEEIAQILKNAVSWLNKNVDWLHSLTPDYRTLEDAQDVSDWAVNAMDVMYRCGIVTATDGKLLPQKIMTRGEAVVMLKQFTQQFVNCGPVKDDGEDWVLTFNDEFQGTQLDANVWTAMDENPAHILSSRHPENVEVHDGAVHLVTKYESKVEGKNWTTGNILANKGAFTQEYGYWEARYKYTESAGINNSFWMMSDGTKDKTWYEIDVCEGHYMNKINTNLHEYTTGDRVQHSERYTTQYDLSQDYHTYGVEWTPDTLKYYFDGQLIHTKNNVTEEGYLSFARLSSAILSWAGAIDQSADGTAQVADYVRVWQRSGDVAEHTQATEHALDGLARCVLEKVEAEAPTCTDTGLIEHYKCTICNKYFADEQGTTELDREAVTVKALGGEHAYEITDHKKAECLENGYQVETCTRCGDKQTTTIQALGHTVEKILGKAATATESGLTEGEKCSVCGTVLVAQEVIQPTGGSGQVTPPEDTDTDNSDTEDTGSDDSDTADTVSGDSGAADNGAADSDTEGQSETKTASSTKTGDSFSYLWYLLLGVSIVGLIVLMWRKQKCQRYL